MRPHRAPRLLALALALAAPAGSEAAVLRRAAGAHSLAQRRASVAHVGTYKSKLDACKNCVTFYPKITEGKSPDDGGVSTWQHTCYTGKCQFDVPWVTGPQDEACKDNTWKCWYWGLQDQWCDSEIYGKAMKATCKKTCGVCNPAEDQTKWCFSLDPIEWYYPCPTMLWDDAKTVMDTARVCEYKHQIQAIANPNVWNGKVQPWTAYNLAGHEELQCTKVIQDGGILYDNSSFLDSYYPDQLPLGPCCERVHEFFSCMGNKEDLFKGDAKGLEFLDQTTYSILKAFSSYCVPMFEFPTREEFCGEFPDSDPCVEYTECEPCTKHGGVWCNIQKSCNMKAKEKCDTNHVKPEQCASAKRKAAKPKRKKKAPPAPAPPPAEKIVPETPFFWKLVKSKNYYAAEYGPNEHVNLNTGKPAQYIPYTGGDRMS